MVSSTSRPTQLFHGHYQRRARLHRPKMHEFLTSYSSDHTLLWALLIIGAVAVAAISFHIFWTVIFKTVASLRGKPGQKLKDND